MGLNAANLFPGLDGVERMLKHAMAFRSFRSTPVTASLTDEQSKNEIEPSDAVKK